MKSVWNYFVGKADYLHNSSKENAWQYIQTNTGTATQTPFW